MFDENYFEKIYVNKRFVFTNNSCCLSKKKQRLYNIINFFLFGLLALNKFQARINHFTQRIIFFLHLHVIQSKNKIEIVFFHIDKKSVTFDLFLNANKIIYIYTHTHTHTLAVSRSYDCNRIYDEDLLNVSSTRPGWSVTEGRKIVRSPAGTSTAVLACTEKKTK